MTSLIMRQEYEPLRNILSLLNLYFETLNFSAKILEIKVGIVIHLQQIEIFTKPDSP
jgi:hypothetical protein